jgi:hypothetical protein
MELESFSRSHASPVHKKAILEMNGNDCPEHDDGYSQGSQPAKESRYKADGAERFTDDYEDRDESRDTAAHEEFDGARETRAPE